MLIVNGADISGTTTSGLSAIHLAAMGMHTSTCVLEFLLTSPAACFASLVLGACTPLRLAAAKGNESALVCLLAHETAS